MVHLPDFWFEFHHDGEDSDSAQIDKIYKTKPHRYKPPLGPKITRERHYQGKK